MLTLAQRKHRSQDNHAVHSPKPKRVLRRTEVGDNPLAVQQQAFGNQAVLRFARSCPLGLQSPQFCPFGGVCHSCPARVQAKLVVGQPNDKYEQEADRIAEQVMGMPEPRMGQRGLGAGQIEGIGLQRQVKEVVNDLYPHVVDKPTSDKTKLKHRRKRLWLKRRAQIRAVLLKQWLERKKMWRSQLLKEAEELEKKRRHISKHHPKWLKEKITRSSSRPEWFKKPFLFKQTLYRVPSYGVFTECKSEKHAEAYYLGLIPAYSLLQGTLRNLDYILKKGRVTQENYRKALARYFLITLPATGILNPTNRNYIRNIRNTLALVHANIIDLKFSCQFPEDLRCIDWAAYAVKNRTGIVFLCPSFFNKNMGVLLIHEALHTLGKIYPKQGKKECYFSKNEQPQDISEALKNADSYAWLAKEMGI